MMPFILCAAIRLATCESCSYH